MLSPWLAYKRQEAGDPAVSIHVLKTTPGAKFTRVFCGMSTRWAFSFPSSGASWRQEDIGDETEQAGLGGAGEAGREVFGKGEENSVPSLEDGPEVLWVSGGGWVSQSWGGVVCHFRFVALRPPSPQMQMVHEPGPELAPRPPLHPQFPPLPAIPRPPRWGLAAPTSWLFPGLTLSLTRGRTPPCSSATVLI